MTTAGATSGRAGFGSAGGTTGSGSSAEGGDSASAGSSAIGSLGGIAGTAGAAAGGAAAGGAAGRVGSDGGTPSTDAGVAGVSGSTGETPCGDIDHDGVDDCTETLVHNSRFDADLGSWLSEALSTGVWDKRNARSGTGSGSLLISNIAPLGSGSGSFMVGTHQCVSLIAGESYEVAARVFIPSSQGAGEAGINLQLFGVDNCAGSFLKAETIATTADVDTWSVVQGDVDLPATARSMWLRLVVSKPFAQATLEALFDDVLVRQR